MKHQIIIALILIIIGCQGSPQQSDFNMENVFFDIEEYFKTEIQINQDIVKSINKKTSIDNEFNTVELSDIDFSTELKLFIESDINKISWIDRYQVDTIPGSSSSYLVNYTALNEKLHTRKISILFNNAIPKKFDIHNQLKSMIMDTDQYLTYLPGLGYSIAIKQTGKLQPGHNYTTEVKFNK